MSDPNIEEIQKALDDHLLNGDASYFRDNAPRWIQQLLSALKAERVFYSDLSYATASVISRLQAELEAKSDE